MFPSIYIYIIPISHSTHLLPHPVSRCGLALAPYHLSHLSTLSQNKTKKIFYRMKRNDTLPLSQSSSGGGGGGGGGGLHHHPSTSIPMYRQPWFIPITALILIIFWLQLSQPDVSSSSSSSISNGNGITNEELKSFVSNEIKNQFLTIREGFNGPTGIGTGNGLLYPPVAKLSARDQLRIVVTGGSGFVGSHLVDRLMMQGHRVTVIDNLFTGRAQNVQQWSGHPNFQFILHDVVEPIMLEVDQIYHLACPASPPHYQYNPIKTIKTSTEGTLNMLGLAKRVSARILLTSTSEVYGDPEVHPQKETYWGNVNPIGPRACYDEGKRVAETMM
jgi:hypothetical protein